MRELEVTNLGLVEYRDGLDLQEELRARVTAGEIPDQLLLLEHPPVVTIGRNAGDEHLVLPPDGLAARGIELHHTGRGGDVTFHGPGQIVGYPVLNLSPDRRDVHRYVRDLEEAIIRTLADFDVTAGRIPGLTGVWIGDLKIAAIGVRISRWITTHGFALNVATDLDFFRVIVPCGISDRGVTSLSRVLERPVAADEVRPRLARRLAEVFGRRSVARELASRSVQVWVWRREGDGVRVLLLKRSPDHGDFWQPVTGMIEAGETPADAAVREVREETGIRGRPTDLQYVRDFRIEREYLPGGGGIRPWINREHAFEMRAESPDVALAEDDEHEDWRWVTPARARELLAWDGNKKALDRVERRVRS